MAKYGKTFWGKEWLNALSHIDFSNRLPRGSSYATRGAVRGIVITGNRIAAKVQGSRPRPYDVTVTVPEFSAKQKARLTELLSSNPAWLAGLLNRQLPEELLLMAKREGVAIFPSRWDDFKMNCSCPDWAVPCKHLAAVIYIIANEIDLNPMRVLELHDYDVVKELKTRKVDVSASISEPVEDITKNIKPYSFAPLTAENHTLPQPDLSLLPETNERFLELLSPHPPFHQKDFREILLTHVRYARKNFRKKFQSENKPDYSLHTCIDARMVTDEAFSQPEILLVYENEERRVSLFDWLRYVALRGQDESAQWAFPLRLLYEYFRFISHLVEKGAMIPQLVKAGEAHFILWLPLLQNEAVSKIFEEYKTATPAELLLISKKGKKNEYAISNDGNTASLISAVMTSAILEDVLRSDRRIATDDFFAQLFFGGRPPLPRSLQAADVFNAIQLWLKKLHLSKRDIIPVLKVDEDYPSFFLSLHVSDRAAKELKAPVPLHRFKKLKEYANRQMTVMKDLLTLQEHFPDISKAVNSVRETKLEYDSERFASVLLEILPVMQLLGMEVILPKSLKHLVKPLPSLKMKTTTKEKARTWLDLQTILGFQWQVAVGDTLLDEKEFFQLVKGMSGIVKLRDAFIHITKDELQKLLKHLQQPPELSRQDSLRILFAGEYEGAKIQLSDELQQLLKEWTSVQNIPQSASLTAVPRPYQQRGFEWLYKNARIGFGSILADDMGLGKTLQVIAFLLKLRDEGWLKKDKALVIVPTTLLTNWSHELNKFAPALACFIYHGAKRNLRDFNGHDLLITSYGTARSDREQLGKLRWQVLIIDEAQNIKNHAAEQTKAIKSIPAPIRIAMSGTPVENRLSEYWSIFDFTNKGFLGSQKFFNDYFASPIQTDRNRQKLDTFRQVTAPFILRRLKTDKSIISDLPDKIENNNYCALTKQQAALYENIVKDAMDKIEKSEGIERRGLVLKMMTALKQVCNHPVQYAKQGAKDAAHSGKLQLLFDLLRPIAETGEKTLVFTQYKEMGELLVHFLAEQFGSMPLFLHGSLTRKQRDEMVHAFQQFHHHKIFILSLKAGGTGLNLTAAGNVIHYDLWWNPAVERQATDRAYRIGQQKNVMVYRLINSGTLEEKIDDMIRSKKELADLTVASGEKWLGELSNSELRNLVNLTGKMEG